MGGPRRSGRPLRASARRVGGLAGRRPASARRLRARRGRLELDGRARAFGAEPAAPAQRFNVGRRGLIAGLGAAAAACVAVVVGPRLFSARYGTALGEIRRVPLSDGSMAAINTDTALDVAMSPRLRHVKLDKGEAWFEVAKDARRPFVVESGPVRVRAVGTAFSVRRLEAAAKCWSPKASSRCGPKAWISRRVAWPPASGCSPATRRAPRRRPGRA
jgi:ferric-dicitrate binding protein FerR (iron transport regulator)